MTISLESFSLLSSCFQLQTRTVSCQNGSRTGTPQPPSDWHAHEPAPKGSAAAQLIGSSPTSGTHGEHTKNKVTPAVTVPLFLVVLPGVPRVVSMALAALCVFSLCAHVPFHMELQVSGSESRNSTAWKHENCFLGEKEMCF